MKHLFLYLAGIFIFMNLNVKAQGIAPSDTLPKFYIGIGTGINSYTGMLGVSGALRLQNKLFLRGAVGLGGWGKKYSIGIKYDAKHYSGWSYCLGYSYHPGMDDMKVKMEVTSGVSKEVVMDYLSTSTINMALAYRWKMGRKNNFNLEFGYALPLKQKPWKITDGSVLSSTSETVMRMVKPGGLVFGLGFTFGL